MSEDIKALFTEIKETNKMVQEIRLAQVDISGQLKTFSERGCLEGDRRYSALHNLIEKKEHELKKEIKFYDKLIKICGAIITFVGGYLALKRN